MSTPYITVFVTVPDHEVAKKITQHILTEKLAACANIVPAIESYFWWEGKIDKARECLLMIKTKRRLFMQLRKAVQSKHPYDVPEIIALPIVSGNKAYLDWINGSCR